MQTRANFSSKRDMLLPLLQLTNASWKGETNGLVCWLKLPKRIENSDVCFFLAKKFHSKLYVQRLKFEEGKRTKTVFSFVEFPFSFKNHFLCTCSFAIFRLFHVLIWNAARVFHCRCQKLIVFGVYKVLLGRNSVPPKTEHTFVYC